MELDALRIATVAALLNGGNQPWPTIAGEFVYDSLRDDILDITPTMRRPVIVVRVDEDQQTFRTNVTMGRQARLLIEISVLTAIEDPATGKSRIDWPKSDPALELMLGVLSWQVWNALRGASPWAQWYQGDAGFKGILGYTSVPRYAPPDRGAVRLAVRTLEYVMRLPSECLVTPLHEFDPSAPPFLPPSIVGVVNYILQNGSGDFRTAVLGLGKTLNRYAAVQKPRLPALQRVWAGFPDYEINARWPLEQAATLEWAPLTVGLTEIGPLNVN